MSPFESFLSGQFEDYIAYRQNLGYDTKSLLWVLRTLDRHLRTIPQPKDQPACPAQIHQPPTVHHPHVL